MGEPRVLRRGMSVPVVGQPDGGRNARRALHRGLSSAGLRRRRRRLAGIVVKIGLGFGRLAVTQLGIAMLLREDFPELLSWNVRILGTDLSNEVLAKAREGQYGQVEINRGLAAPLLMKYFTRDGLRWMISGDLKRMVEFQQMNLATSCRALEKIDDEAAALERVLKIEPRHLLALLQKAELLARRGKRKAAASTYHNALQTLQPDQRLPAVLRVVFASILAGEGSNASPCDIAASPL